LQKELKEHLDKLDFNYITDEMYQLLITEKGFYKVYNLNDLTNIVREAVKYFGPNCNLNWLDVSGVSRMNFLFKDSEFNGDISEWDVSNVNDMEGMFMDSDFNGDISKWDVSSVEDMQNMFNGSKFNGDISKWDVSKVDTMNHMFCMSEFNGDISKWDVSNVTNMAKMFMNSKFGGDISNWDVSNVDNFYETFIQARNFKCNLNKWKIKKDLDPVKMLHMFDDSGLKYDTPYWYNK
jgi:surface protein